MKNILEHFYLNVINEPSFGKLADNIRSYYGFTDDDDAVFSEHLKNFIEGVYEDNYTSHDSKQTYNKIRRNKFTNKKLDWYTKAKSGYETYKETREIPNGFYSHLARKYDEFLTKEQEVGKAAFNLEHKATVEEVIRILIESLEKWGEDKDSHLSDYPFFYRLSSLQKNTSFEVDMAIQLGKWLIVNEESFYSEESFFNEESSTLEASSEQKEKITITPDLFIHQAPVDSLEHPYFGISKKTTYKVDPSNIDDGGNTTLLEKKSNFEMEEKYKMGYKSTSKLLVKDEEESKRKTSDSNNLSNENSEEKFEIDIVELNTLEYKETVRTLDMIDFKLYIDLVNKRGKNFNEEKKIYTPLIDLVRNNSSQGISQGGYNEVITRLIKLAHFELSYIEPDGTYVYKKLISSLMIGKNKITNQTFVEVSFSETVFDNIIKQQCINVYDQKLLEISQLAYHLVFLIQKKRIQNFKMNKLRFTLEWSDFISIRLNKRSRKENIDDLVDAFKEIQEKGFLVKEFKVLPNGIVVTCFPLNEREIEDMNTLKLDIPNNEKELSSPLLI